jgi:hypothetical protein
MLSPLVAAQQGCARRRGRPMIQVNPMLMRTGFRLS